MKLQIWSHLLEKSLMENLIFCAVNNELKNANLKTNSLLPKTNSSAFH